MIQSLSLINLVRITGQQHSPVDTIKSYWRWCVKIHQDDPHLMAQCGYITLNTVILATKIFQQIPSIVSSSAYTLFSYLGMASIGGKNGQFSDLVKSGNDLFFSLQAIDMVGMFWTASKVAIKALNIFLTCGMFAASLIALCGFPSVSSLVATTIKPCMIFSWPAGIVNDLYDYVKQGSLIRRISKMDKEGHSEEIMLDFSVSPHSRSPQLTNTLSRHVFQQLHLWAVNQLREEKKQLKLKDVLKKLEDERGCGELDFKMFVFNYACLSICKGWPLTLVGSSVRLTSSLVNTYVHLSKKQRREDH